VFPRFRRLIGRSSVNSYFCIVNLPGAPVRDIEVLDCRDDASAAAALDRVTTRWPGFETVYLYEGERLVAVRANPDPASAGQGFDLESRAA
jgi:hypothetical protein